MQPHFEVHAREAVRTRRRFGIWTAGLVMVLAVAIGLERHTSIAASALTVSGRVVDISNGVGLPNVVIKVCGGGTAVTSSGGYWSYSGIESGSAYCVEYVSGTPKGLTGPYAVDNNPAVGGKTDYLNQVAGMDCYSNVKCSGPEQEWDRSSDSGFDFAFISEGGAAANETPGTLGVGSYVLGSATKSSDVALAASATGPSTPTNFQATVGSDNAVISLIWSPSSAPNGLKGYEIDTSLDEVNWTPLATGITTASYTDKSAEFGVHYYFRLSAIDQAGNVSGYATTDAITPSFVSNNQSSSGNGASNTSFTSDDGLVSVQLPPGTISENVDCSVTDITFSSDDPKPSVSGSSFVMGPYDLICKDDTGNPVETLSQAVSWVFQVKGLMGGLVNPEVYAYSNGGASILPGGVYNAAAGTVTINSTTTDQELVVMASKPTGVSPNLIFAGLAIVGIIIALSLLILRQQQQVSYKEYLRKKYFNL
jgi:hypothetical protein